MRAASKQGIEIIPRKMGARLLPVIAVLGALPAAEGGGSGPSVFELRGAVLASDGTSVDFHPLKVAASFCVVIVFTILAELSMHRIEHTEIMHLKVVKELWHMIVKELMILGLISFIIFISVQLAGLSSSSFFLPLEFAHITIFGIAVFLVAQTILHFKLTARSEAYYANSLRMTKEQLEVRFNERLARGPGEGAGNSLLMSAMWQRYSTSNIGRSCCCSLSRVCLWITQARLWVRWHITDNTREVLEMLMVQANFVSKHHLQQNFDFARFVMHSLRSEVVSLVDIKIRTWTMLMVLIWSIWGVLAFIPPCASETARCSGNETVAANNQTATCYVHPPLRCDYPTIAYICFGWTMLLINVAVYVVADIARSRAVVIDTEMEGGAMTPIKLKEHTLMKMQDSTSTDDQIRDVQKAVKQRALSDNAKQLGAVDATPAAAKRSDRPALVGDAASSTVVEVQEEQGLSPTGTIRQVEEEGESSSTGPDTSDSDADDRQTRTLSARAAALGITPKKSRPTKRLRHFGKSYSDADFTLPQSYVGQWNLSRVFLVPEKILHGVIENLFVFDCLNKSLFFCYFMAKYVADAGKFIGIESGNGKRDEVAKDILEIILIVTPMMLNTILVTPAVTRKFFFISAVSKPSKENLVQTYDDMREHHQMRVWFLRKLFHARPGDFTTDSFKDWITEQFKSIDHDNDGKLQKRELKKAIRETLRFRIRGHKFAELWRMLDENGSGAVTMDEFIHFVCAVSPKHFLQGSYKSFKIGGVTSRHSSRRPRLFSGGEKKAARTTSDPPAPVSRATSPRTAQRSQTMRIVHSTAQL